MKSVNRDLIKTYRRHMEPKIPGYIFLAREPVRVVLKKQTTSVT